MNQYASNAVEDILKSFAVLDNTVYDEIYSTDFSIQSLNKTKKFYEITIAYEGKEPSTVKVCNIVIIRELMFLAFVNYYLLFCRFLVVRED